MARKQAISLKRLMRAGESVRPDEHTRRMPRLVPWKVEFSCPLSPHIMWWRNLRYKSCPIGEWERDMDECSGCPLRAKNTDELIAKRQKEDKRRKRRKKDKGKPQGNRRQDSRRSEPVVVEKGKPYVSP